MAKDNLIGCRLDDNELKFFNSLVFQSGLTQTEYIKSKIFPSSETEEDRQKIKNLLLKIIEQNDMIQKIILSSPNNNENVGIIKLIRKLLKQEFVTYALLVQLAIRSSMGEEKTYNHIDKAKAKADEVFGKDE